MLCRLTITQYINYCVTYIHFIVSYVQHEQPRSIQNPRLAIN